jgi:hypothetical protein
MKYLLLLCILCVSCARSDGDSDIDQPGYVASISINCLPEWVSDPTQGGKYQAAYGFARVTNGDRTLQRETALASARKNFSAMFPGVDPKMAVPRTHYVDPMKGTLFIWIVKGVQ